MTYIYNMEVTGTLKRTMSVDQHDHRGLGEIEDRVRGVVNIDMGRFIERRAEK